VKRTVAVGAITVAAVVGVLAVTALLRGPPRPITVGLGLVLIFWLAIRSAIRRYGPRRD